MSTKASAPSPGFGTSDRAQQAKLHISKEHAKTGYGLQSPGPQAYSLPGSTGQQHSSRYASSSSWGFGTASRWAADKPKKGRLNVTPGPGSYCV